MVIEMEYDPYDCRTRFAIDGQASEAYSQPFSQIARFPLQAWLYKRLDWPGLESRLKTLARGSYIRLRFIGRSIDFEDVKACLEVAHTRIDLEHEPRYEAQGREMGGSAGVIVSAFHHFPARAGNTHDEEIARMASECQQTLHRDDIWVRNLEEYRQHRDAIRQTCRPLFITSDAYGLIQDMLERDIAGDFARPYQSVYIVASSEQEVRAHHAQQELGMGVGAEEDAAADRMRARFAMVGASRMRANGVAELKRLIEWIDMENDVVRCEIASLKQQLLHEASTKPNDEKKLGELAAWIKWYDNAHPSLIALMQSI